jgi:cell pole-organizing protein PopZ
MADSVDHCGVSAHSRRRRLNEAMTRPLGRDLVMTIQGAAVPKQSVEEIFTSIRRKIAEHDSSAGQASPMALPDYAPRAAGESFAPVNHNDCDAEIDGETPDEIEFAIEKAIDGFSAVLTDIVRVADHESRALPSPDERDDRSSSIRISDPHPQPSLSAPSEAPVADSLEHLAETFPELSSAQVGEMAEELLRPMLKAWLDRNLPRLVKRLVGEEIQRVSRRR